MKFFGAIIFLFSITSFLPTVEEKEVTIDVTYSAISCPCAQWILDPKAKQEDREYIYLERSNDKLPDANGLWDGETLPFKLRVKGNFKPGKGIPDSYKNGKGNPEPARIFLYTSLKELKDN